MKKAISTALLILLSSLILSACSVQSSNINEKQSREINSTAAKNTVAINLKSLNPLSSIIPELANHRVVFVGESHTSYGDHLNQLAIIKGLHKQWGKQLSIGLEMVQQPYQSYLDDYVEGKITERNMLKGVEWYKRWVYDFRLYRPIFQYAKKHQIPLRALNIPRELTRRISKVGIDGLKPEERKQLPKVIDRSNKAYADRLQKVFGGHSRTMSKGFKKFMDAQLGWDEGMAFNAANYLNKNTNKKMVVLAGGGHVINREGIPSRLDRQIKSNSAVVLNNVSSTLNSNQGDFLLESDEVKLPPAGLMGIFMGDTSKGVLVSKLSMHGAARKAGVMKGDIIIAVNGEKVSMVSDVKLWGLDKKPKDKVNLRIKRNGKLYSYDFLLKSPPSKQHALNPHK